MVVLSLFSCTLLLNYSSLLLSSLLFPSLDRYRNAIRYTDDCLEHFIKGLKDRGIYEDTLIILSGDHGEAFGVANQDHPTNFLHKNYLFEENVRTFLILHDPREGDGGGSGTGSGTETRIVSRVSSVADIMPTILEFASLGPATSADQSKQISDIIHDIVGQSQLQPLPNYTPRMSFFHKTAMPLQWGVRDGHWKFISNQVGSAVQLYDLRTDPREQNNLLLHDSRRPNPSSSSDEAKVKLNLRGSKASPLAFTVQQMAAAYSQRCLEWYLLVHCYFIERLEGYSADNSCEGAVCIVIRKIK